MKIPDPQIPEVENTIYVVDTAKIVSNPMKYKIVYLDAYEMDCLD